MIGILDLTGALTTLEDVTFFDVFVSLTGSEVSSLDRMSSSLRMFLVLLENFFVGDTAMTGLAPLPEVLVSLTAGSMVCLRALEGLARGAELRLTELRLDLVIRVTDWSSSNVNWSADTNSSSFSVGAS